MAHRYLLLSSLLAILLLAMPARAQDEPVPDAQRLAELERLIESDDKLGETERGKLQATLAKTSEAVKRSQQQHKELEKLQARVAGAESQVEDYRRRISDIEQVPQTPRLRLGRDPSLDDINAEIAVVRADRDAWADERKQLMSEASQATDTANEARNRLTQLSAELEALGALPTGNESVQSAVSRALLAARKDALATEKALLELQLRAGPALSALRTARAAWLDAAIAEADNLIADLRALSESRRATVSAQRQAETRRILAGVSAPNLTLLALRDQNLAIIEQNQVLTDQISRASEAVDSSRRALDGIEENAAWTHRRLAIASSDAALKEVLQTRLASLPNTRKLRIDNSRRAQRVSAVATAGLDTERALRSLPDRQRSLEQAARDDDAWDAPQRRAAQRLVAQQRELLESQLQSHKQLERLLVESNQLDANVLEAINEYRDVLTANLLWLRSYDYLLPERLQQQFERLADIDLGAVKLPALHDFTSNPWVVAAGLLLMMTVVARRRAASGLNALISQPLRPSEESVLLALKALGLTLTLTLPLPLLFGLASNALERIGGDQTALAAIAEGLQKFAGLLLLISLMDRLSARQGVGRRLLKWSSLKIEALRADLVWAKPALLLASALMPFGLALSPIYSGGAIAALGSALAGTTFFAFSLRALRSGQFNNDRTGRLILQGTALVSGAVLLMHLTGQLFAAHMYLRSLGMTLTGLLLILPAVSLVQRRLLIYRSQLQRRTRSDLREQEEDNESASSDSEVTEKDIEMVASLDDSYERLLGVCRIVLIGLMLWWIWSPALPALDVFSDITLWQTVDSSLPGGQLRPVTLSTLLLSLLIAFVTVLLSRHLPPMANVLMLEWGNATSGSRYATTMLMQYVIIGVGASLALIQLGFEWSKVQWLVAALGVGIGFGLQEIVANFISGIILLFERPIRVGDIVNAGGQDGTVTRINPRATVIETFDGKEVLVPNKDLITGVVTNWSLSSTRLRVVVPVGIAYGSDVASAMRILLEEAQHNERVLEDPAPWVTFEDFGDNALALWLRCYTMENWLQAATELRVAIYEHFNREGISIAFPQRDVHLDASSPIPVTMIKTD